MIDFDNVASFPEEIRDWVMENRRYFLSQIDLADARLEYLRGMLQDLKLREHPFIKQYLAEKQATEIAVWHATRIESKESFLQNGITLTGKNTACESRLVELFHKIGMDEKQVQVLLNHIYTYWERDLSRVETVCFFAAHQLVYEDDQVNAFALNLGGECVRWAIRDMGEELYRTEPYKRLWILGTPSVIQFKCRFSELPQYTQSYIVAEIAEYFIATDLLKRPYKVRFTGEKYGGVLPENILRVEEIENFVAMQEKYAEYQNFYR